MVYLDLGTDNKSTEAVLVCKFPFTIGKSIVVAFIEFVCVEC